MSFEVKSRDQLIYIDMKDCLKYLDKGKVLHKVESKIDDERTNDDYITMQTTFSSELFILVELVAS